jgi:hypothetical protein
MIYKPTTLDDLIDYESARAVQLRRWHEDGVAAADDLVAWLRMIRGWLR